MHIKKYIYKKHIEHKSVLITEFLSAAEEILATLFQDISISFLSELSLGV